MTTQAQAMASAAPSLSQRRILLFWLPLAASWLLMSTEMPFANAMIARLGETARTARALGQSPREY